MSRLVIALAGRRIDPDGANERRFPPENLELVKDRIRRRLSELMPDILVSSAAAGTDLLALDIAREEHVRSRIVLPFSVERFRVTSVSDQSGSWAELYDGIIQDAGRRGDLVVLEVENEDDRAYRMANDAILNQAVTLADDGEVMALIAWEGTQRTDEDLTASFAQEAQRRKIPISEISTI